MKFRLPLSILLAITFGATSCNEPYRGPTHIATVADDTLHETSGLAASRIVPGRLWAINDGGWPATLHAIGIDGASLARIPIANAENVDWEDLAAFEMNGARHLLIADVGDNSGSRETVSLYIVPEPELLDSASIRATRRIDFRYPDGPRDAEAVAVDGTLGTAYVLAKRTLPPELYEVPLTFTEEDSAPVTARYLGPVTRLPPPSDDDVANAPIRSDWHWQPTAMDFSADGRTATILTYHAAYVFDRDRRESWYDALQSRPRVLPLGDVRDAESACLWNHRLIVTTEGQAPSLLRIDF